MSFNPGGMGVSLPPRRTRTRDCEENCCRNFQDRAESEKRENYCERKKEKYNIEKY
jgi:hypothetical protein